MEVSMPAISVLVKPASGSCNMHCDYCFYCDEQKKRRTALYGFMSDRTLKNVIKRTLLRAEGSYSLAFQGGEPTLCGIDFFRNAVKYARQYNRNQAHVSLALQTNGYGITEEWAEFFAENQFLVGISVDGLERIHSSYRHGNDGGDSWQHAMNAIRLFEEHGVEYNILTVVHRETAENILENVYHHKMPDARSLEVLKTTDVSFIKVRRRENARVLANAINEIKDLRVKCINPLLTTLDTPLFVPIMVTPESRNLLRRYLIDNDIYCPVHWPLSDLHKPMTGSKQLFESELSLICDQRYGENDMKRIAVTIKEFLENN